MYIYVCDVFMYIQSELRKKEEFDGKKKGLFYKKENICFIIEVHIKITYLWLFNLLIVKQVCDTFCLFFFYLIGKKQKYKTNKQTSWLVVDNDVSLHRRL